MSTKYDKNMSFKSDGNYWIEDVPLPTQEVSFSINVEWHGFLEAIEGAKEMSRNIPHLIHYYCTEILKGYTPRTEIKPPVQQANFAALIQALGFDQALEEIKAQKYDIEKILKDHFTK